MNVDDKKTVLDDSAQIYQIRKEKTERQKWKELHGFSERLAYFKAYYLLKVVIFCIVGTLLVYIGITMFKKKPDQIFYAAVIDNVVPRTSLEQMEKELFERLEAKEGEEELYFDATYLFMADYDYSTRQRFMVQAFAGQIDVAIMPESLFLDYAAYFVPLAEQLPTDLYMALSDKLVYAPNRDEEGNAIEGSEQLYGIDISGVALLKESTCKEPVIVAIMGGSSNKENVVEFIRYLFGK